MKAIALLFVCLSAAASATHTEDLVVTFCDTDQCGCTPAQTPGILSLKLMDELGCYCSCGALKDEACSQDGDCIRGLHCAAGDEMGGHGRCEDACKKPGFHCDKFEKCKIATSGEPTCDCKMFRCSEVWIGMGVCANDPELDQKVTFMNDCQYVNLNCERLKSNQQKLKMLPIRDCAETDPIMGAGFNPFQFENLY